MTQPGSWGGFVKFIFITGRSKSRGEAVRAEASGDLFVPRPRSSIMATGDLLGMDEVARPEVAQLKSMFPNMDKFVVESILDGMAGGSVQRATELLMELSDDSVDMNAVAKHEQEKQDELLALQILQQVMNEEGKNADPEQLVKRIQNDKSRGTRTKGEAGLARQAH